MIVKTFAVILMLVAILALLPLATCTLGVIGFLSQH